MTTLFFLFNDPATTEIYTLSRHDALPICSLEGPQCVLQGLTAFDVEVVGRLVEDQHVRARRDKHREGEPLLLAARDVAQDRKSTRLNSSHANISYAVFCLKKKNNNSHFLP